MQGDRVMRVGKTVGRPRGGLAVGGKLPGDMSTSCLKLPAKGAGELIKTGGGGKRQSETEHT